MFNRGFERMLSNNNSGGGGGANSNSNNNNSSNNSKFSPSNESGTPVYVNIYDMYTMNNYTSAIGFGVYHTGVEIYGTEYSYGGHPYPFSGIFEMTPRDCEDLGETFNFKESILIGRTDFTSDEIEQMITLLGREFRGVDYHLMNKNCNHFTDKLCKTICGVEIPAWINRLAYVTTFVPFVERLIPKEWISPLAVQHQVEHQLHDNPSAATTTTATTNSTTTRPQSSSTASLNNRAPSTASNTNTTTNNRTQSATTTGITGSSIFKSLEKLISK